MLLAALLPSAPPVDPDRGGPRDQASPAHKLAHASHTKCLVTPVVWVGTLMAGVPEAGKMREGVLQGMDTEVTQGGYSTRSDRGNRSHGHFLAAASPFSRAQPCSSEWLPSLGNVSLSL